MVKEIALSVFFSFLCDVKLSYLFATKRKNEFQSFFFKNFLCFFTFFYNLNSLIIKMHMAITLFSFVFFFQPFLKLFCFYIFYLLIFVCKHVQLQYVAFESVVMAISDAEIGRASCRERVSSPV